MADLLIRDLEPDLKRRLEERAQKDKLSLSEEAKRLLQRGLLESEEQRGMGTWLASLVPPEYRGDDLVVERRDIGREPPDFE